MRKESEFLVYCMEIQKRARKLAGKQVYELFERFRLFDFVLESYDLLHVHGEKYILQDIDDRIAELSVRNV